MCDHTLTRETPDKELMHYGVLGMKWGIRRARKLNEKAKASRQRGNLEKAKKLENKAKKITAKHVKLAGGKKTYDYVKKQDTGKAIVKSVLMGTYGTLKYDQARSRGVSTGRAAVKAFLYESANVATSGLMSVIEPRMR